MNYSSGRSNSKLKFELGWGWRVGLSLANCKHVHIVYGTSLVGRVPTKHNAQPIINISK